MLSSMNSILSFGEKLLESRPSDNDQNTVTQNLNTAFDAEITNKDSVFAQSYSLQASTQPSPSETLTAI
jgi:hypothetical protein